MKTLPNYNLASITSLDMALCATEENIRLLAEYVGECSHFTEEATVQLINSLIWLRRFFETAESFLQNE